MDNHNEQSKQIWARSLSHALKTADLEIKPTTQIYLTQLINQYMYDVNLCDHTPIGIMWIEAQSQPNNAKRNIQDIGDKCLIISSFFPMQAQNHNTNISYYIQIGRSAYGLIADHSHLDNTIFHELKDKFIPITQTIALIKYNHDR